MVEDLLTSLKKYELRREYKSLDFNVGKGKQYEAVRGYKKYRCVICLRFST